jgi:serine protease
VLLKIVLKYTLARYKYIEGFNMHYKTKFYPILICVFFLNACSSDTNEKEETQITFEPNTQSAIKGTIRLTANLATDSDLNDINTVSVNNSLFSSAQEIENFVTIQGFATKVNTSEFEILEGTESERKDDRFYSSTDEYDVYHAQFLQEGQTIYLQTVNSNYYESDDAFSGDVDLHIFDSNYQIVGYSDNITEYDSVTIPSDGEFYIRVRAFSGASKYVLKLLPSNNSSDQSKLAQSSSATKTKGLDFVPNQLIIQFSEQNILNQAQQQEFISASFKHPGKRRPTLVKFSDTQAASVNSSKQLEAMSELASLNQSSHEKVMTLLKLKTLQALSQTEHVSLNFIRKALLTPSDTLFKDQWHYNNMNLTQAWDITTGIPESGNIIVAVIDTGIFSNHKDLINQLVDGYDFISDSLNSKDNDSASSLSDIDANPEDPGDGTDISSSSWHGTHVAGIIAAETNNEYGIAGVSWGAKIMPLRVLGTFGGTSYDIMQAVRYAAGIENDSGSIPSQSADIINLSLGGPGSSPAEQALFSEIHDLGIIVVAAAGNESSSQLFYPASYNDVISVSALDLNSNLAPYSNFGTAIDIAAPGGDLSSDNDRNGDADGVLSTLVEDSNGQKNATFAYYQGTSMAAPHISGMFALMKAVYPELDAKTVDNLLANNLLTNDIGSIGRDDLYGFGSANALKAVQQAISLKDNGPPPQPVFSIKTSPSSLSFYNATEAVITIKNEGTGSAQVSSVLSNAAWLSANYTEGIENGLGSYLVQVDKSELQAGAYNGEISFELTSIDTEEVISPATVIVNLQITEFSASSKIAELVVVIFDSETFEVVKSANGSYSELDNGTVSFNIDGLNAGNYFLYTGTDIDYDGYICQYGEACGIYPSIGNIKPISLGDNSTVDLNISAYILSPLNTLTQTKTKDAQKSSYEISLKPKTVIVNKQGISIRTEKNE